jgi:hypothetical protein
MAEAVSVEVRQSRRRFEAEARLELAADAATVWNTITDYAALPAFMPGIRACRVLERHSVPDAGEQLLIEQRGEFRLLLFAQSMTVRLRIEHQSQRVAQAQAVSFDLGLLKGRAIDVFEGRYELAPQRRRRGAACTHLSYCAVIGLRLPPPPAIGAFAVRSNLAAQLEAVAREVARRSARPQAPVPSA